MEALDHTARRASLDSPELRVVLEGRESQGWATLGPPGTEGSLGSLVSLASPERLVFPERKAPICPAPSPESLESPVSPVSLDDQELKGCLVPMETQVVLVLTEPKEKEEIQATEANQDSKVSQDPEETPVSQEYPAPASMELVGRTECLVYPELRASPERCWGPLLDLPEATAFLGPPETRASLGLPEDLEPLVWMDVLDSLG